MSQSTAENLLLNESVSKSQASIYHFQILTIKKIKLEITSPFPSSTLIGNVLNFTAVA